VAETIFDFAVNAGVKTASKLAQNTVGATVDGFIGRQSIALLNKADPEKFKLYYALSKIRRYSEIVRRNPSQVKFLRGWINRTIEAVS
ncbi:MAG: putative peptidoglycan-binding domain-containing protein, partial [Pseudomonadota bacterium]|nr:putative peptidoglycan-binding domain-containing protein [Pseudomonadota bacterium]